MPLATSRRPPPKKAAPAPARTAPAEPRRSLAQRAFFLDVPFQHRGFAEDFGAVWEPVRKHFIFYGDSLPGALQPYHGEQHSLERLREDARNDEHGIPPWEPANRAPEREIKLREHQLVGGRLLYKAWKAERPGFLVADDVGLGKTFQTWNAIMHMADVETVLIVCPLAVVAHWRRSIRQMGDKGKRVVVINYDRLKKLFDVPKNLTTPKKGKQRGRKRVVRTQKGIARFGQAHAFDVIVWDESHKLRNRDSARSKLAAALEEKADFLVWMSATAGQTPMELGYLAPLIADAAGCKEEALDEYEKWAQGQGFAIERGAFGKWMWAGDGDVPGKDALSNAEVERLRAERAAKADADLVRMRELLFGGPFPQGIRRSPTDIAGWPEINRILLPVALEGEDRFHYEQAWGEFRDALELERQGRPDPKNALVIRLRFRQKASLLRTAHTVDHVEELLGQGLQVAVSVAFHDTLDVIREALEKAGHAVCSINGRNTPRQNEQFRLDFQHGRAKVCLFTVEEGISLHEGEYVVHDAPRACVVHDVRWSAIQMKQIEGRTHRDGKFSQVYWMVGDGTVEERLAGVVGRRVRAMGKMQGDDATVAEIEGLLAQLSGDRRA